MSKHTPGEWQVERGNVGSTHPLFVVAPDKDGLRPWCDADAHLISAAPDLYAVAKEMREAWAYFSEYDVPINLKARLDAAIAKAEGGAQ